MILNRPGRPPFEIYLINLDTRRDRLIECEAIARREGFVFKRFSAIDASAISCDTSLLTKGAQACLESHKKVLAEFLDTEYSHALVLEDDFQIVHRKRFWRLLNDPRVYDLDFLQFGYLRMNARNFLEGILANLVSYIYQFLACLSRLGNFSKLRLRERYMVSLYSSTPPLLVCNDIRAGAHCYLISRNLARSFLSLNDPPFLAVDGFFGAIQWGNAFKMARCAQILVTQRRSWSSITSWGIKPPIANGKTE